MFDTTQSVQQRGALSSIRETFESLIIAFILAFIFRAFVVEAFVIPTGSMADTLRGAHFRLTCPVCGHQYNFGFNPEKYGYQKGYLPSGPVNVIARSMRNDIPTCAFCGHQFDRSYRRRISNGDRILVLKYIYQFVEPRRWDVVVFKNPTDPRENFIKRLIARPREKLEVINGDVYINDQIQRKPPHVQDVLWLEAFNNDYQPQDSVPKSHWPQPFQAASADSPWHIDQYKHLFEFTGADQLHSLTFDPGRLDNIVNLCEYNGPAGANSFISSDLKLSFVLITASQKGHLEIRLGKYGRTYSGIINFDGTCTIHDHSSGRDIASAQFPPLQPNLPIEASFALVDHSWRLCLGDDKLVELGPSEPAAWGYKPHTFILPTVDLFASGGSFNLDHIVLYRDTYYTNTPSGMDRVNGIQGLGTEGNAIILQDNQFFVMGDNSPLSHDSRFWSAPGLGNNNKTYRTGTVPRDYLIGKAFFVYWPSGFRPHPSITIPLIPNAGKMRFIY